MYIDHALREVESALRHLASLGHLYHLVEGPEGPLAEYPKTVWHGDGRSRLVHHPVDLIELGEGWYDTLGEAKQTAGMRAQFVGRGGQRMYALPAIIYHKQGS